MDPEKRDRSKALELRDMEADEQMAHLVKWQHI